MQPTPFTLGERDDSHPGFPPVWLVVTRGAVRISAPTSRPFRVRKASTRALNGPPKRPTPPDLRRKVRRAMGRVGDPSMREPGVRTFRRRAGQLALRALRRYSQRETDGGEKFAGRRCAASRMKRAAPMLSSVAEKAAGWLFLFLMVRIGSMFFGCLPLARRRTPAGKGRRCGVVWCGVVREAQAEARLACS